MCTTRILSHTKLGFITQCQECASVKVAFGTTLITLKYWDFELLSSLLCDKVQFIDVVQKPTLKCIQLTLPTCEGFSFVLTHEELIYLNNMVQEALLLLATYNILGDE